MNQPIPRVVGALTTLPHRYRKLSRTLKSLIRQNYPLDVIYLSLPKLTKPFPPLPNDIINNCVIVSCEYDYGPITKLMGVLSHETNPNTIIITFDDDVVYHPTMVTNLIVAHKNHPDEVLGSSGLLLKYGFPFYSVISNNSYNWNNMAGFTIPTEGRLVDVVSGFSSALYIRKFFPGTTNFGDNMYAMESLHQELFKYVLSNKDIYNYDDLMICAYLSKKGIKRRVVDNIPVVNQDKKYNPIIDYHDVFETIFDKFASLQSFHRAFTALQQQSYYQEMFPVSFDETIGGTVIIAISLVSLLLLAIIMCCKYDNWIELLLHC